MNLQRAVFKVEFEKRKAEKSSACVGSEITVL